MNRFLWAVAALAVSFDALAEAPDCPTPPPCEKRIQVDLSQKRLSLNPFSHLKGAMNTVEFVLPVSCSFYDKVREGDQLLSGSFRWGLSSSTDRPATGTCGWSASCSTRTVHSLLIRQFGI